MTKKIIGLAIIGALVLGACSRKNDQPEAVLAQPRPMQEYTVADSSQIQYLTSGLGIYVVQEGPGEFPRPGSTVLIDYVGRLKDGSEFDNSYKRPEPFTFSLGSSDVILGMAEGVSNLRYGSKAILIIPPDLAYKEESRPNIPANSTLIFHIHLLGSF
jgi:peptidylprolyl isomerase